MKKIQVEIQSEIHGKNKFQWLKLMTQYFTCKLSLYTIFNENYFLFTGLQTINYYFVIFKK